MLLTRWLSHVYALAANFARRLVCHTTAIGCYGWLCIAVQFAYLALAVGRNILARAEAQLLIARRPVSSNRKPHRAIKQETAAASAVYARQAFALFCIFSLLSMHAAQYAKAMALMNYSMSHVQTSPVSTAGGHSAPRTADPRPCVYRWEDVDLLTDLKNDPDDVLIIGAGTGISHLSARVRVQQGPTQRGATPVTRQKTHAKTGGGGDPQPLGFPAKANDTHSNRSILTTINLLPDDAALLAQMQICPEFHETTSDAMDDFLQNGFKPSQIGGSSGSDAPFSGDRGALGRALSREPRVQLDIPGLPRSVPWSQWKTVQRDLDEIHVRYELRLDGTPIDERGVARCPPLIHLSDCVCVRACRRHASYATIG